MNTTQFKDSTYSLSKGLHNLEIAKNYFEDVKRGCNTNIKHFFEQSIFKIDWVIKNVTDRLPNELRSELNKDLSDSLGMDAILDGLVKLNSEQRLVIENLINAMNKGEEIKVEQENY